MADQFKNREDLLEHIVDCIEHCEPPYGALADGSQHMVWPLAMAAKALLEDASDKTVEAALAAAREGERLAHESDPD